MSKITFRADDELVEGVEQLDASKSEVMRAALRAYLDGEDAGEPDAEEHVVASEAQSLDDIIAERVDELVTEQLDQRLGGAGSPQTGDSGRGVNVNVSIDPAQTGAYTTDVGQQASPQQGRTGPDGQVQGNPGQRTRGAQRPQSPQSHQTQQSRQPQQSPHAPQSPEANGQQPGDRRQSEQPKDRSQSCGQCGESMSGEHVYCPNCGNKAVQRLFCECGDEVRSDWAFCPHCGRRTASADVLEQ